MKLDLRSRFFLGLILAGLMGCGSGQKEDESKVPIDVKKAEMADSTRLDSAPDSTGVAVDSLAAEDGERKRRLRFR